MNEETQIVEEYSEEQISEFAAQLDSLGILLARTRAEAINGRLSSGIESDWREDEEYYEGIDAANRGESRTWSSKPPGQVMPDDDEPTGSTVFVNITAQYCDAVAARIGDMLLPTDDSAFEFRPTPVPELMQIAEGEIPEQLLSQLHANAAVDTEETRQIREQDLVAQAQDSVKQAAELADRAQKRVEDWHVECQYHAEVRRAIEDCCKIGTGILKGPIPEKRGNVAYRDGILVVEDEIKPATRRVDPWNFFPDSGCGENLHNGAYTWERDDITARQVKDLKGTPGYIDFQIDSVLKEGPHKAIKTDQPIEKSTDGLKPRDSQNLYEIWYMYGQVKKSDFEAAMALSNPVEGMDYSDECETVDVQATFINNAVVGLTLNPLDSGDYPYDAVVIKKRNGVPWGTGISRQVRAPQRIVNGAARNLMDNAGIAGGPMIVINRGVIEPSNGIYEIKPRKIWLTAEGVDVEDVSKGITYIKYDMMQDDLQAIIYLGMKLAEDVVGLPMIMQGQMGQTTPDRVGVVEILNSNASTVLRRIARLFDDLLTEPHVRRYYRYLMQYGDDNEKGELVIDARGSSALVERQLEAQEIIALSNIVSDPTFGLDKKKWAIELLKGKHLDPKRFQFDDDEWMKILEGLQQQTQQQDPRLQIAQMRAETDQWKTQFTEQAKAEEADKARQFESGLAQFTASMEQELKAMEQQGNLQVSADRARDVLAKAKTDLTKTVLTLKVQKEMAGLEQVAQPLVEPPGRARPGYAFQQ